MVLEDDKAAIETVAAQRSSRMGEWVRSEVHGLLRHLAKPHTSKARALEGYSSYAGVSYFPLGE